MGLFYNFTRVAEFVSSKTLLAIALALTKNFTHTTFSRGFARKPFFNVGYR